MGILQKIGLAAEPATVFVGQPANVPRERMEQRLERVLKSIDRLEARKVAKDKVKRLKAEAAYLQQELSK